MHRYWTNWTIMCAVMMVMVAMAVAIDYSASAEEDAVDDVVDKRRGGGSGGGGGRRRMDDRSGDDRETYRIGVGRADCTGPPVEVVFMGYAHMAQRGKGLHLRQYARAFIVEQGQKRLAFVSVDSAMMAHTVKRDVLAKLHRTYGDVYTLENTMISGTHTHGTPGGYMMDVLYDMTTFGFVAETHYALVDGIYRSIVNAHERMRPGRIHFGQAEVLDANINRSPSAYRNNPEAERAKYKYDTDKTLTQLRFVASDSDELMGAINWFAVHPTSMNRTNCLITTDNVGYASLLLEKKMNPGFLPGRGKFVGAFAATNLGDVSPNIMGPKCQLTGRPCDLLSSSCPAKHGMCVASGPGANHFESTKIIAGRMLDGALRALKSSTSREVRGPIRYTHQFINMPAAKATYIDPYTKQPQTVRGCLPAMGYSFAAGTTDGPGAFDFTQGTTTDNPLWNAVRDFLSAPTKDDIRCQSPKPILLATGRATFPYEWQPHIVATQTAQIGDVYLAAVPGEFTTMSGRRMRAALQEAVLPADRTAEAGGDGQREQPRRGHADVIVVGLANMYTSYVATPEEYQVQRYEGASTVYGPHTLTIYVEQFMRLARAMVAGKPVPAGPEPPRLDDKLLSFQTNVLMDTAPGKRHFGDVLQQPEPIYYRDGADPVRVLFVAGNPRNDLQHERTYFTVERLQADGDWTVVAVDSNWETWFVWRRTSFLLGQSTVEVFWEVGADVEPGMYRIRHFGAYKKFWGSVFSYVGASNAFKVK